MKNKLGWNVLSSVKLFQSRWYELRQDRLLTGDGKELVYTCIQHPGSVFVVPVSHDGQLILIRSYRYPINEWCWEIPAGTLGDQADIPPSEVAITELKEEIGASFASLHSLGSYYIANGIANMKGHYFLALGVQITGNQDLGEGEIIDQIMFAFPNEAKKMIVEGKISDADSAFAILIALERLREMREAVNR